MHYKSHILRSLYPLLHSLLVIVIYCTATCCWIRCPCIRSPCWKTDPQWTNPHYSLQCLRTRGTTCDTYKWLACTVCLGQSCCRAWPDGLWSTLLLCNTHAACPSPKGGLSLQFTYIIRWKKCSTTRMSVWFQSKCEHFSVIICTCFEIVANKYKFEALFLNPSHLLKKFVFCLENKGTRKATFVTVIHVGEGRWCKRSLNVNAAVIRVVLIPRAWQLSMHQSQPCVSRGEPTGINLEPEVKV